MISFATLPATQTDLAHAFILEGADQTRVIEQAEQFAALLLCTQRPSAATTPCGQCQSCDLLRSGNHPDRLVIGNEGQSVGVDEVRSVSAYLAKTPHIAGKQVVLIYNADAMTESAANAVLKTLEEPTNNSYLVLLSESRHNQSATIRSRCQIWTTDNLDKATLKQQFADMPDYLIGFASGVESRLQRWQEAEVQETFNTTYQAFIGWLKGKIPVQELIASLKKDEELEAFLLYLIERRIRQLLLKSSEPESSVDSAGAIDAQGKLTHYQVQRKDLRNQSLTLALTALLQQMEYLIR